MLMHVYRLQESIASCQHSLTAVALTCSGFLSELGPYYPTKNGEPIFNPLYLHTTPAALTFGAPAVQEPNLS